MNGNILKIIKLEKQRRWADPNGKKKKSLINGAVLPLIEIMVVVVIIGLLFGSP